MLSRLSCILSSSGHAARYRTIVAVASACEPICFRMQTRSFSADWADSPRDSIS